MNNTNYRQIIDLIKYPIITDKATRLLEINQYTFATDIKANKEQIKLAIEYLFQVKVRNFGCPPSPLCKLSLSCCQTSFHWFLISPEFHRTCQELNPPCRK